MFVRLMSHEMRTPITVARGYTELVRSAHADEQTSEDTAVVLDELAKLDRSTQRLVTLIAVDHGGVLEEIDVDEVLDRVHRRWSPTTRRRWRVKHGAGSLLTDGERLETALDCLVENAVTYTSDDDLIEIAGRQDNGIVTIEVTDTGVGIPIDDLSHVFDSFHRGANSAGRAGTGLGLAIVRRTVEAWGGTVAVRSTLGSGATFTLRLPVVPSLSLAPTPRGPADGLGLGPTPTASVP
jgi:two-component system, OmpR family, sensor kinase